MADWFRRLPLPPRLRPRDDVNLNFLLERRWISAVKLNAFFLHTRYTVAVALLLDLTPTIDGPKGKKFVNYYPIRVTRALIICFLSSPINGVTHFVCERCFNGPGNSSRSVYISERYVSDIISLFRALNPNISIFLAASP